MPWLIGILSAVYLLLAGEIAYRFMDGFEFTSLKLQPRAAAQAISSGPTAFERKMLEAVTFDRTVDHRWFFEPIAWPARPTPPELAERTKVRNFGAAENYVWNENYLRQGDPSLTELFNAMQLDAVYAFRGYSGSIYPRYRLLPMVNAGGGPTNQFGFLYGADLALRKGAKTIRVAWLGDSTSAQVNNFLDAFFRAWSRARGDGVEVEVINAARNATDLHDMAEVLRYELAPFGIDYVISYSGNRIALDQLQGQGIIKTPPGVQVHSGKFEFEDPGKLRALLAPYRESALVKSSALVRHGLLHVLGELPASELVEPAKPAVELVYTPAFNDTSPVLTESRKIHYLGRKLTALDAFNAAAREHGMTPLVSTELIYVQPGMVVRHRPNRHLYAVANGATYSPLRYADIRRALAAHNAVIAAWARENSVALLDTARIQPQIPILSGDTVHDTALGIRMRAWIAFQTLLPMIERDLKSGRLPRQQPAYPGAPANVHPFLIEPPVQVQRKALVANYALPAGQPGSAPGTRLPLNGHKQDVLSLDELAAVAPGARIEPAGGPEPGRRAHLPPAAHPYAASLPVRMTGAEPGRGIVVVRGRATAGRAGICLLARSGLQIGPCQVLAARSEADAAGETLHLLVPELAELSAISLVNAEPGQGKDATVVVNAIELWRRTEGAQ